MNLSEIIKNRRSIRAFKDSQIPHDIIEQIVEDASYSPSWKHTQTPRYILVEDKDIINKISQEMILDFKMNESTLKGCSAVMVISYVTKRSGYERDGTFSTPKRDGFEMFDAGVASQTFCLSAYDKGIGTVITGYFNEEMIIDLLNIPQNQKIAALICMGYPAMTPDTPKRKEIREILSYR